MEERRAGMMELIHAVGELKGEVHGLNARLDKTNTTMDTLNSRLGKVENTTAKGRGIVATVLFFITIGIPAAVSWIIAGVKVG